MLVCESTSLLVQGGRAGGESFASTQPPRIGKKGGLDVFFQLLAEPKKKNTPKNTPKFLGFFAKTGLYRFVEALKKRSKMSPKIPRAHSVHTFFSRNFREGHFWGFFGTFNLKSRVKFPKKVRFFDVFLKNIFVFFAFYRLEVVGPTFYMRRKSELSFFDQKKRTRFSDRWSDFVLFLTQNFRGEKKKQRLDFTPIGPLLRRGGSVFLTFFSFKIPALK